MASGGGPGVNRLFFNDRLLEHGAIGVVLRGGPRVTSIVSQGCRPIGTPFVVTKADRNIIFELGGITPLQRLQQIYPELPKRDQELVERGVHLGVVMNEYQDSFQRGDFLIVNVHGVESNSRGALLFSCNGRGSRMFPDPNHDALAVQQCLGPMPLAGFFAQGELGPVGAKNYIHGFTASVALFEDA